jgi:NitT/TauT family transport system ATP-binding protein
VNTFERIFPVSEIASTPGESLISFLNVAKYFGSGRTRTPVIEDVSLNIAPGRFISFVGPSGCGKTTLLNMLAGLVFPDTGAVIYDGKELRAANAGIGYMTQHDALLPWRRLIANVALPLEIRRVPKAERLKAAQAILRQVGLAGFERHYPGQLSGGMRKRAALARTLIYQPKTLLLDEPFSALDSQSRVVIQKQVKDLAQDLGLTVLLVTHDIGEAIALSDSVVVFSPRPARILDIFEVTERARTMTLETAPANHLFDKIRRLIGQPIDIAVGV